LGASMARDFSSMVAILFLSLRAPGQRPRVCETPVEEQRKSASALMAFVPNGFQRGSAGFRGCVRCCHGGLKAPARASGVAEQQRCLRMHSIAQIQ
jgi:hypothetical protein